MTERVETWEVTDGRRSRRLTSRQVVERLMTGELLGTELARLEGQADFRPLAQTELFAMAHPSGSPLTVLVTRRVTPVIAAAVAVLMTAAMTEGLHLGGWGPWALLGVGMWALAEASRLIQLRALPQGAPAAAAPPDELTLARQTIGAIDARLAELADAVHRADEPALLARLDGADPELATALRARLDAAQAARDAHAALLREREILTLELDAAASQVAVARARDGHAGSVDRLREVRRRAAAQVEVGRR